MQEENAWQGKISISFMARLLAVGIRYPGGLNFSTIKKWGDPGTLTRHCALTPPAAVSQVPPCTRDT